MYYLLFFFSKKKKSFFSFFFSGSQYFGFMILFRELSALPRVYIEKFRQGITPLLLDPDISGGNVEPVLPA